MFKIKNFLKRCFRNETGVSSIEFAIVMPLLILMMTGVFETGRFLLIHQKADKVAYAIGDIVSQQTSVSKTRLDEASLLINEIMTPFENDGRQRLLITSFEKTGGTTKKNWDYTSGGGTVLASSVSPNDVDAQMNMQADENIIVTEMQYNFQPVFLTNIFPSQEINKISYFRPRFGSLTTITN